MIDIPRELLPYVRVVESQYNIVQGSDYVVARANAHRWLLWFVGLPLSGLVDLRWEGVASGRGFRIGAGTEKELWVGRHGSLPTFSWLASTDDFTGGELWVIEVIVSPPTRRRKESVPR